MEKEGETKKIDQVNIKSYEVREILGKTPSWMIRWGITVIFIIVIFLLTLAHFISYDDIVNARISITTKKPPAYIQANTTGNIKELYVKTDESINKGGLLAEIENTADLENIYWIKRKLSDFKPELIPLDSISLNFPLDLRLGTVRESYAEFVSSYQSYVLFNTLEPNRNEIVAASKQISNLHILLSKQRNQLSLFQQELLLSKVNLERNKLLIDKGVISKSEFEIITRGYLSDKQNYEILKGAISTTEINITDLSSKKTQTLIGGKELTYNYSRKLENSFENLKNTINEWELKFVLKSPIKGKVSMFDVRSKFQNVTEGDVIFTIVPEELDSLVGQMIMPIRNSGKVKKEQEVIIKSDNYPYQEWGSLKGKIKSISAVPLKGEAVYFIYVDVGSLKTSFRKKLEFKQEMQGDAEIITEKLSVLERIFYQLNEVFSR